MSDTEERAQALAEARSMKEQALEARKKAALRVLEDGGTLTEAAAVARADRRTVARWRGEARQDVLRNYPPNVAEGDDPWSVK